MKALNVKIPLAIAQRMDDIGELNPMYIGYFIATTIQFAQNDDLKELEGIALTYTFKVPDYLHKDVKELAELEGVTMGYLVGKLLTNFY